MKIISWNVNGINASIKKDMLTFLEDEDADIYCFQEIKVSEKTILKSFLNSSVVKKYHLYWNEAEKNGYSGTMILTKKEPLAMMEGLNGDPEYDSEGRLITLEFPEFYLINGYLPNAGRDLKRLDFKLGYNSTLWDYLDKLRSEKPLILCGDLNVAHKEIDLANPSSNHKTAGFTPEERKSFSQFLERGYIDTYREFVKEGGHYTYWSYRTKARERNVGWRLDYFIVNEKFMPNIKSSDILADVLGSDHCPVRLILKNSV